DRLYAFALRLSGSLPDAQEIAQDAFVRAYRALLTYPAERIGALQPRAWLFQITRNVYRNRVRRRELQQVPLEEWTRAEEGTCSLRALEGPDAWALRAERRLELTLALGRLPERQRSAVILRHIMGLGYDELAATLHQPVGTAKSDVHRGVRTLRTLVTEVNDGQAG
ncbi:MAG: RNA polymerase sigma factor, partial [Chloroflexota bacterium]